MADTDPKVMAYVEKALAKDPDISGQALYDGAKKVSAAVGRMNRRQFHARYPLQIKRRNAGGTRRAAGRRKTARGGTTGRGKPATRRKVVRRIAGNSAAAQSPRDAVRSAFMLFASDLAAADERKDVVRVLARVDDYVDDVLSQIG